MNDLSKTLSSARRRLIADLKRTFARHMYDSGYAKWDRRTGDLSNSRPLKLWAPKDKADKPTVIKFPGYTLTEFWGITEDGVITDAYGGGCVTVPLRSLPLEDLMMLSKWAATHFATPAA